MPKASPANDEPGGKCSYSSLGDVVADLGESHTHLVTYNGAIAANFLIKAAREDLPVDDRKKAFKVADQAIDMAVVLHNDHCPNFSAEPMFRNVILRIAEITLRGCDPASYEECDKEKAAAEEYLTIVACESLRSMVECVYEPKNVPPEVLGSLGKLALYATEICSYAVDSTPSIESEQERSPKLAAARCASMMYSLLTQIHDARADLE